MSLALTRTAAAPTEAPPQRDGVAVRRRAARAPRQVKRRHVLADAGRHDQTGVAAGEPAEEPGQQVVGQLAGRQREAEPDDVVQLAQAADHEVAVGRVRHGVVHVARAARRR